MYMRARARSALNQLARSAATDLTRGWLRICFGLAKVLLKIGSGFARDLPRIGWDEAFATDLLRIP